MCTKNAFFTFFITDKYFSSLRMHSHIPRCFSTLKHGKNIYKHDNYLSLIKILFTLHIHIHTHTHTHTYIYVYVCMCICVFKYVCVYIHYTQSAQILQQQDGYNNIGKRALCIYMYIYMYIYIYIYINNDVVSSNLVRKSTR